MGMTPNVAYNMIKAKSLQRAFESGYEADTLPVGSSVYRAWSCLEEEAGYGPNTWIPATISLPLRHLLLLSKPIKIICPVRPRNAILS